MNLAIALERLATCRTPIIMGVSDGYEIGTEEEVEHQRIAITTIVYPIAVRYEPVKPLSKGYFIIPIDWFYPYFIQLYE